MKNQRLENLKNKLLKNPKFKKAYFERDLAFEMGQKIFEARLEAGWSQEKLAQKIDTKQPGIARLEGGAVIPSLPILEKIADALGIELELPRFTTKTKTVLYPTITVSEIVNSGGYTTQNSNFNLDELKI